MSMEELLSFIETGVFTRRWKQLGLTIDDLIELEVAIMAHPAGAPVIAQSGGLRKMRFSPSGHPRGKSGSHRVCYVYFENHGLVLLVTAYSKNQQDDIAPAGLKEIRMMIEYQRQLLDRRATR